MRSSRLICTPGAEVSIGLKGPPVGAPGLRSQMSIVGGPAFMNNMMQAFFRFCISLALARKALVNDAATGAVSAAEAAKCDMK